MFIYNGCMSVSYTHLDVYKRQLLSLHILYSYLKWNFTSQLRFPHDRYYFSFTDFVDRDSLNVSARIIFMHSYLIQAFFTFSCLYSHCLLKLHETINCNSLY